MLVVGHILMFEVLAYLIMRTYGTGWIPYLASVLCYTIVQVRNNPNSPLPHPATPPPSFHRLSLYTHLWYWLDPILSVRSLLHHRPGKEQPKWAPDPPHPLNIPTLS